MPRFSPPSSLGPLQPHWFLTGQVARWCLTKKEDRADTPFMTAPGSIRGRRTLALVWPVCALALLSPSDASPRYSPLDGLPLLMLWAWERPEDLRGLDESIGVAFLSQTITLGGDRVSVQPRRQPLRVAPEARLMAVTRIEIAFHSPALLYRRSSRSPR